MAEKLFPDRQRCKACRGSLGKSVGDEVYQGLYCSPRCSGLAEPAQYAVDAPRECRTQREGQWHFKRRYRSLSEIPQKIQQDPSTSWYWCSHCGHLHIGHSRVEAEKFRALKTENDLGDFLTKRRGRASVNEVAKAAGVRPIRIKELESGTAHVEGLKTLLKLSRVLRFDLGVAMQKLD